MSTPPARWDQWLAAAPNYLPDYNHTQQIIGTTIYVAIVVITVVTFIIIIIIIIIIIRGGRGR